MDLTYNDKKFDNVLLEQEEGTIRFYKYKDIFIIRTYPRGLITALKIFKEWVEANYSH